MAGVNGKIAQFKQPCAYRGDDRRVIASRQIRASYGIGKQGVAGKDGLILRKQRDASRRMAGSVHYKQL